MAATRNRERNESLGAVQWIACFVLVILFDLTVYSGEGFAGVAAAFLVTPLLMLTALRKRKNKVLVLGILLLLVSLKSVWLGSFLLSFCGFLLLFAFSLSISGVTPNAERLFSHVLSAPLKGVKRTLDDCRMLVEQRSFKSWNSPLAILIPIAALFGFGLIFVFANPNLMRWTSDFVHDLVKQLVDFDYFPTPWRFFFWCFAFALAVGLLRPLTRVFPKIKRHARTTEPIFTEKTSAEEKQNISRFEVARNTLLALNVLFVFYLLFEFSTLWFREFPENFYYAGYAHQGAAWLTFALVLASATLSLIFQPGIYEDERLTQIWKLARLWIALNFVLALAVYNRLWIYIDFNGMTKMRIVGVFGISTVVAGFVLMTQKIRHRRSLRWLVRNDLKALFLSVLLFAVLPIDRIWVGYNTRCVNQGELAPSVQLVAHPIDDDGVILLTRLLDHEDQYIRDGVKGILARRLFDLRERSESGANWTAWQWSSSRLQRHLEDQSELKHWADSPVKASRAVTSFFNYAYQWY